MLKRIPILLIIIGCLLLIIEVLFKLRLGFAILYALLANTVFHSWANTNTALSNDVLIAILALTTSSWVIIIVKHVSENRENESRANKLLAAQI